MHKIPHNYFYDLILLLAIFAREYVRRMNKKFSDESEESLRGDTEDEGIEHDAEEDELDGVDDGVDDGEGGRRKQSTGSRLSKSGVARELVTHCRLVLTSKNFFISNRYFVLKLSHNFIRIMMNNDIIQAPPCPTHRS